MNMKIMMEIIDLRDYRIRLQRRVAALEDKYFWEPEAFTADDAHLLSILRKEVAYIKSAEEELRDYATKGV